MMADAEVIFALSKIFDDREKVDCVVKDLFFHKSVWLALHKKENLSLIESHFGNRESLWTITDICSLLRKSTHSNDYDIQAGKDELTKSSNKIDYKKLISDKNIQIGDLWDISKRIATEIGEKSIDVFVNSFPSLSIDEIDNYWGTIFTLVFLELKNQQIPMINCLININQEKWTLQILAFMLAANSRIKSIFSTFVENNSRTLKLERFSEVTIFYENRYDQIFATTISKIFLEKYSYDEIEKCIIDKNLNLELPKKFSLIKSYIRLAEIAKIEDYLTSATNLAKNILKKMAYSINSFNEFDLKTNVNTSSNDSPKIERLFDDDLLISQKSKKIIEKIHTARKLMPIDKQSAQLVAREIFSIIINNRQDIDKLFWSNDFGFVIAPEQISELFIDLGLESEIKIYLEYLVKKFPNNLCILEKLADLDYSNEDFGKAVEHLSRISILRDLSREEKNVLSISLENTGNWNAAYAVRKKINILSIKDLENLVVSAIYAHEIDDCDSIIKSENFGFAKTDFYKIFSAYKLRSDQEEQKSNEIISEISGQGKIDQRIAILINDYYISINAEDKGINFLENYFLHQNKSPGVLIKLLDYYYRIYRKDKIETYLNEIDDFVTKFSLIEKKMLIEILINRGEIQQSSRLINSIQVDRISTQLEYYQARILLEKNQYGLAEAIFKNIILYDENNAHEYIIDYCLSVLKSSRSEFPIKIDDHAKSVIIDLFNLHKNKLNKDDYIYKLLEIELNHEDNLLDYQDLIHEFSNNFADETWRIYGRLGMLYYNNKKFDLAIVNIKEAIKNPKAISILISYLLDSYLKLNLWEEAFTYWDIFLEKPNVPLQESIRSIKMLNGDGRLIPILEKKIIERPDRVDLIILIADCFFAANQIDKGKSSIGKVLVNCKPTIDQRLLCAQILLNGNQVIEARRIIEIIISNQNDLSDEQWISCAFLLYQMGEKNSVINLIHQPKIKDWKLEAFSASLKAEQGMMDEAIDDLMALTRTPNINNFLTDINEELVIGERPEIWKRLSEDPTEIYTYANELCVINKSLNKAYDFLENGIEKINYHNVKLVNQIIDIAMMLGDEYRMKKWQSLLEEMVISNPNVDSFVRLGEVALILNQEVGAANYLSLALKINSEDKRLILFQSRLLARNGNLQQAELLFNNIINKSNSSDSKKIQELKTQNQTGPFNFWLARSAYELSQFRLCLDICQKEIQSIGLYREIISIYLSALISAVDRNGFLELFKVKKHQIKIFDKDFQLLKEIGNYLKKQYTNDGQLLDRLFLCEAVVTNNESQLKEGKSLDCINEFPLLNVRTTYLIDGIESAEEVINSIKPNPDHYALIAGLILDKQPEIASKFLRKALSINNNDPVYLAGLAFWHEITKEYEKAYSTMSLAIEVWQDEFEWEKFSSFLCMQLGDIRKSYEHLEKANRIEHNVHSNEFMLDYLIKKGSLEAIEVLKNDPIRLESDATIAYTIGEIYYKNNLPIKATFFLEKAHKIDPYYCDPLIMLGKIALDLNNVKKTYIFLEKVLRLNPDNVDAVLLKAELIYYEKSPQDAIIYLDEMVLKHHKDEKIILKKLEIVERNMGKEAAIGFINSLNDRNINIEILSQKIRLLIDIGKFQEAQQEADRLISLTNNYPPVYAYMGQISKNQGNLDQAIDFYVKAIRLDPIEIDFYIKLAEIHDNRREIIKSLDVLRNGLKINKDNVKLRRMLESYLKKYGYGEGDKKENDNALKFNQAYLQKYNQIEILRSI